MDTNKMTDAQRAEFEVVFRAKFGFGATAVAEAKSEDGAVIMGAALWAWKASRDRLAIALPATPDLPEEPEFALDDSHMDAYHAAVRMREACVKAIQALGLQVAP
ncbi:hypothetical protein F3J44_18500 [Pantoea sp. Tr-811]|uniref:hypothetical protein n=1 Tax=Pantoea sp. Tr-811 TaxID=2608361 RepID=UPI001422AE61|nr:hypothetical protein [Pantoea sp. Tr-811]NIF28362.1 hypothetical protein [Pantoea sp. Tr-811]